MVPVSVVTDVGGPYVVLPPLIVQLGVLQVVPLVPPVLPVVPVIPEYGLTTVPVGYELYVIPKPAPGL